MVQFNRHWFDDHTVLELQQIGYNYNFSYQLEKILRSVVMVVSISFQGIMYFKIGLVRKLGELRVGVL